MPADERSTREVYFEFTSVGSVVKVTALDAATAIEVSIMGPASVKQADFGALRAAEA